MKIVTSQQIRELDRVTSADYGVPGSLLMERAGAGVAGSIIRLCREQSLSKKILLVAGKGNNGGDAFVAARVLKEEGFDPLVLLAGGKEDLRGDALLHFRKMLRRRVRAREVKTETEWKQLVSKERRGEFKGYSVVVDGVLGTGLKGAARGAASAAIRFINSLSAKSRVVAIDIPSGLDSDSGAAEGEAVRADLTVTMGLPKKGLVEPRALAQVGRLEVVDIGFPDALVGKIKSDLELIGADDIRALFPRRQRDAHKGNYGHLLIVSGASGYSGAVTLAALAALRSGAGLVTAIVPRSILPVVAKNVPEAMIHGAPQTAQGSLTASCWKKWRKKIDQFTAVLAGPGMTRHPETLRLVKMILRDARMPVVLDADALNVFESNAVMLAKRKCPLVITPHPGEMARLLGMTTKEVQARRFDTARNACVRTKSTVVLKGAGTLVAEEEKPLQVNMTGNPGMAKGGMGDALAGLLGGLLAQGLKPFNAARAAVWLHGRAGDLAASRQTEQTMIVRDLLTCLPQAFLEISG